MNKMEPQSDQWVGATLAGEGSGVWPKYNEHVNTERELELDPHAKAAVMLSQETGLRHNLHAVISNAKTWLAAITELEDALIAKFGGFTCHVIRGGWKDEHGRAMVEQGLAYDVSADNEDDVYHARLLFALAGRKLGERWVHMEHSTFEAMHQQVNE